MTEWQPIETAPRGGKSFLVWCPDRLNIYLVWRSDKVGAEMTHFGSHSSQSLTETPTHWMPLPDPPKEQAA